MKYNRLVYGIYRSRVYQKFFKNRAMLGERLLLLYPGRAREDLLEEYHLKKIKDFLSGVFLCIALALAGVVWSAVNQRDREIRFAARPSYHEGDSRELLEAEREDGTRESVELYLSERRYTDAEAEERLRQAVKIVDDVILGENESANAVDLPLVFKEEPLEGVYAQWMSDQPDVLDSTGEISEKFADEGGKLVNVRAVLICQEQEAVYDRDFLVFPRKKDARNSFLRKVDTALAEADLESVEEEVVTLPEEIDGERVIFRKRQGKEIFFLAVLTFLAMNLLSVCRDERIGQEVEKRRKQLLADYPGLVSKFTVLLRSGLTVQSTFARMAKDYRKKKEREGCMRYAYEEMLLTYYEMFNGIPEGKACENFGKRCGLLPYMRLGGLLSQNIRRGNKHLLEGLAQESLEAFEEQKRRARKSGEEAGTKMLLPMILMLLVTILIILYPAFSTFQI